MADGKTLANPLFLREEDLRQGIELLFFAYRDFTAEADALLARLGFGRAHHRVIYFVGRKPGMTVSELLDIPVYDSQCGLKLVPRACFEAIEARLKITGFAFDVELLTTLLDSGCAVVEVPISWHETPGGKVRLLRDSFLMARDVLKIKAARGSAS